MGLATTNIFKQLQNKNPDLQKMSDGQLKQLQRVLLSVLSDIDKACTKHGLKYILAGGSCLGAVRHNGFIPWDDDADLCMPREDFDKFRKVFKKELGENYWLQCPEDSKDYTLAASRIRKKGTVYRTKDDDGSDQAGIYIDISVVENTYNFVLMRYLHGFLSMALGLITSCRNFYANRKLYLEMVGNNKAFRRTFKTKIFIGFLVAWRKEKAWAMTWNRVNKMCKNSNSKYVVVPTGRKHFFGELYPRDVLCKVVQHKFEDKELLIPAGYDGYLKHMYGDYMKLPPKNTRETHTFLELDFGGENG